jgi:hypothetical protein
MHQETPYVAYVQNVEQLLRHKRHVHSRKDDDDGHGANRRAGAGALCVSLVLRPGNIFSAD